MNIREIALLISLLIYLISFISWYRYVRIAHSKGGIYYGKHYPTLADLIVLIVPIINTAFALCGWYDKDAYPYKAGRTKRNYRRVFLMKSSNQ